MNETLPSARRALLNRLQGRWQQHAGWPGAAAAALLGVAALLAFGLRPGFAARESAALRKHVLELDSVVQRAADAPGRDPRDALRESLPLARARGQAISALMARLAASRLVVQRVDYRSEDEAPGLLRLRVALPVQGDYAALRETVAALLNAFPNAALDGLDIDRPADAPTGLTAQLRLSLYFRRESP